MEWQNLYGFVLVIVMCGVLLGAGILLTDKFGDAVKNPTIVTEETIAIAATGIGTTANDELNSVSFFGNGSKNSSMATDTLNICEDTPGCGVNYTAQTGVLHVRIANFTAGNYKITYDYDKDSAATDVTDSITSELGNIASTWLGVIIVIAICAILVTMVMKSFGGGGVGKR